jgi:hypothetical protein
MNLTQSTHKMEKGSCNTMPAEPNHSRHTASSALSTRVNLPAPVQLNPAAPPFPSKEVREHIQKQVQQKRAEWEEQFNYQLKHKQDQFDRQYHGQAIPQDAINHFQRERALIRTQYFIWVEQQSKKYENHIRARYGIAPESLITSQMEGLSSQNKSPPIPPSLLDDDVSQPDITSLIEILVQKVSSLEKENSALHNKLSTCEKHLRFLEAKVSTNQSTESKSTKDSTFRDISIQELRGTIAGVAAEVSALKEVLAEYASKQSDDIVTQKVFEHELNLIKLTFGGKCALIEKILGIDITTTGPKPGDLLELLHQRLWYLEVALPAGDPWYKMNMPYQKLSEFVRPNTAAANRTTNYAAVLSYKPYAASHTFAAGPPKQLRRAGNSNGNVDDSANVDRAVVNTGSHPGQPSHASAQFSLDPQDFRFKTHTHNPPQAHVYGHPLQRDPTIPKGPKPRTSDSLAPIPTDLVRIPAIYVKNENKEEEDPSGGVKLHDIEIIEVSRRKSQLKAFLQAPGDGRNSGKGMCGDPGCDFC